MVGPRKFPAAKEDVKRPAMTAWVSEASGNPAATAAS